MLLRPPKLCGERHGWRRCAGSRRARSRAAKKSPKQFVIRRIVIHYGGRSAAPLGVHGRSGPVPGDSAQRCANFARCSSEIVFLQTHEGEGTSDFGFLCTVVMGGTRRSDSSRPLAEGGTRKSHFLRRLTIGGTRKFDFLRTLDEGEHEEVYVLRPLSEVGTMRSGSLWPRWPAPTTFLLRPLISLTYSETAAHRRYLPVLPAVSVSAVVRTEAPNVSSARSIRSRETDGFPLAILAMRDWLEPISAAAAAL